MTVATTFTSSCGLTRFEAAGPSSGRPVLFVPGMSYPMEVWSFQFAWLAAKGLRVCRFDLPGRGGSGFDGRPLTLERLANHLREVVERVELQEPVTLIALSNSDFLSAAFAILPDRVKTRALLWVAPSGWDPRTMRGLSRHLGRVPFAASVFDTGVRARFCDRMKSHRARLSPSAPVAVRQVYDASIDSVTSNPAFVAAVMSQMAHMPSRSQVDDCLTALARRSIATTLFRFTDENDSTDRGVQVLLDHLPLARTVHLPGTHMGLLDHSEALNAAIWASLEKS